MKPGLVPALLVFLAAQGCYWDAFNPYAAKKVDYTVDGTWRVMAKSDYNTPTWAGSLTLAEIGDTVLGADHTGGRYIGCRLDNKLYLTLQHASGAPDKTVRAEVLLHEEKAQAINGNWFIQGGDAGGWGAVRSAYDPLKNVRRASGPSMKTVAWILVGTCVLGGLVALTTY